ncbi:mechanosensitive ion channel family protein [Planctobacterium marinum]|uniref:Mechanosensitive ion channel protein n=1 Tax=Planctobacterium marinum TaxID=1631968 RepID=A0AA48HH52_9ALTE|nr:mechanosensitive ion channel protein [Planctobacterium marinum]
MATSISEVLSYELVNFSGSVIVVSDLLLVLGFVILGWLMAKLGGRFIANRLLARNVRPDLVHLIRRIFTIVVLVLILLSVLQWLSIPLTAFAFLSGAVAIGVGFGAQNIINNFISGWILMWERPIRIGDFLEVSGDKGTVESINTRSTRIRRVDGVHLLIPNSRLLENTVTNWTLVDRNIRTSVQVGVIYGTDPRLVERLIGEAVEQHKDILNTPPPIIVFDDFGDNALKFEVFFWINASVERDLRAIRSDIRYVLCELFDKNNVVFAFPQRDVHVDGHIKIHREPS